MRMPKFDIEGHIHFVTTNTSLRHPLFMSRVLARIVVDNLLFYAGHLKYELVGYVVMPDHLHALIFPRDKILISKIMQSLKKHTAREIINCMSSGADLQMLEYPPQLEHIRQVKAKCIYKGFPTLKSFLVKRPKMETHRYQIWQEDYYDFNVFSETKLNEKLNYIHNNPVVWGLVETPDQYLFSSYRQWNSEQ